jgi:uncharacterized protein (TIGR02246 family)
MRKITVSLILVLLAAINIVSATPRLQRPTAASHTKDEAAIRAIVQQIQDGWNAGDGKAFAAPFAEDADYVVVNGMQVKGRDLIASGHQRIFDTFYKNSKILGSVKSIRFIRPDVAIVHIEWSLEFTENGTPRKNKSLNSQLITKENGRWSIAAFHNTSIAGAQK